MEYLPNYPDNYFDLAICDPPYGGGGLAQMPVTHTTTNVGDSAACSINTSKSTRGGGRFDAYAKREVWKNGRDLGDEVPDEWGYV